MDITWYPRHLLVTAVFLVLFAVALNLAIDAHQQAAAGVLALLAYIGLEVWLTFNPARLPKTRRTRV
jgi:hypothetical protein